MFDALLRLPIGEFDSLAVQHIYSQIDDIDANGLLTGYTEWRSEAQRALSYAWDWTYESKIELMLPKWPTLRTNLMLVDAHGHDTDSSYTRRCVERRMTRARWEHTIAEQLGLTLKPPSP